jgi:hypothetical protein
VFAGRQGFALVVQGGFAGNGSGLRRSLACPAAAAKTNRSAALPMIARREGKSILSKVQTSNRNC